MSFFLYTFAQRNKKIEMNYGKGEDNKHQKVI